MPADFAQPLLSSAYTDVLSDLKARDVDALTLCYAGDPSNIPTGAVRYNRGSDKFQQWSGTAWVDLVLSLAGGGTGAISAAASRTALGLGTMAIQDSSAISVTGGSISSGASIDAGAIKTSLIAQARLGSGSGGAGDNFLADNQTWKPAISVLTGTGIIWFTNTPPSGYLVCDGSAISRTTYAALFAVIGTTYGVGDGSTTFNLPDLRQKFPIGKAASGTANTLAGTGGAIDHTHTGAAHTHTVAAHSHTISHTHNFTMGGPSTLVNSIYQSNDAFPGPDHHHDGVTNDTNSANSGTASLTTDSTTPGAGSSNNPPFIVVNYCIKF